MFKGLNKLGKGISKGFNQVKRHVKTGASKFVKKGIQKAKKNAMNLTKHLKKDVLDQMKNRAGDLLKNKTFRKLTDAVLDVDAAGNPLLVAGKVMAPKLFEKYKDFKDKGAAMLENITGLPLSEARTTMNNLKQTLGLPASESNAHTENNLIFHNDVHSDTTSQYDDKSDVSSLPPSDVSSFTLNQYKKRKADALANNTS